MDNPTPTPPTPPPTPPPPPSDPAHSPPPPPTEDPRLRIPEILREQPGDTAHPASPASPGTDPAARSFAETAKAWGMALDLVFTTIGGLILGSLFDWWRGTAPYGAIIGLGIGFVTAFIRLIRLTLSAEAKSQAQRKEARSQRHQ